MGNEKYVRYGRGNYLEQIVPECGVVLSVVPRVSGDQMPP